MQIHHHDLMSSVGIKTGTKAGISWIRTLVIERMVAIEGVVVGVRHCSGIMDTAVIITQ
jgi:hypothetical protein